MDAWLCSSINIRPNGGNYNRPYQDVILIWSGIHGGLAISWFPIYVICYGTYCVIEGCSQATCQLTCRTFSRELIFWLFIFPCDLCDILGSFHGLKSMIPSMYWPYSWVIPRLPTTSLPGPLPTIYLGLWSYVCGAPVPYVLCVAVKLDLSTCFSHSPCCGLCLVWCMVQPGRGSHGTWDIKRNLGFWLVSCHVPFYSA